MKTSFSSAFMAAVSIDGILKLTRKATQRIAVRSEGSTVGPQSRASRSIAFLRTLSSVIG